MKLIERAREAFTTYITNTVGWTEFAKMNTQISGEEVKECWTHGWLNGYIVGMIAEQERNARS